MSNEQLLELTAGARIRRRQGENPTRSAHADAHRINHHAYAAVHDRFHRVQLDVPEIEVDTSDGYRPTIDEIVNFLDGGR